MACRLPDGLPEAMSAVPDLSVVAELIPPDSRTVPDRTIAANSRDVGARMVRVPAEDEAAVADGVMVRPAGRQSAQRSRSRP